MLTFTQRLDAIPERPVSFSLALTAEERTRSRHRFEMPGDQVFFLRLPRGTVLRDGDFLQSETGDAVVQITAKPEHVIVVTANSPLHLLRAAYHLGNRHVPLEVASGYLRLSPDPVLKAMLEQLGVQVQEAVLPFQPEAGAYEQSH
jgi:urease accessory protein